MDVTLKVLNNRPGDGDGTYPLHPGSFSTSVTRMKESVRTYIAPRLGHETGENPFLHTETLYQELEQYSIVCHA